MFKGKNIILGVTSSIAAYKSANFASALVKKGCNVNVLMTENATNFINPLTFEELTKHKCIIDTFDRNVQYNVAHISLAVSADAFIIAPASANVIGKIANGIADDMLTTTVMACKCPVIISPAMNTNMYENPIVQDNLAKLERFGYIIVPPAEGRLACGTIGKGKMPDEQVLLDYLERALSDKQDFKGKRVLVTAGPTQESIDPVRYITNHSSGKMGYAVARQAMLRGAEVTLVSGKVNLPPVPFVKMIYITTAEDMYNAVTAEFENTDIVIKAAAVADFRPKRIADDKLKKADGRVNVENISFSYRKEVPLLTDISIDVKPGQRIAIVGPTGCGKTTMINLLMRFYDVDKGQILVSGHPVKELTRDSLRRNFGMVLQETWLKAGTIRENIAYGKPDATLEEVMEAARHAHAHSFIKRMPNGYDTVISEGGGNISQGQKQLLCIARVMLMHPAMLILDEATSSIDTRTEVKVQKAFAELMEGRTSFIVAHRLSTIQEADLILVMKDGNIIEQGKHEELLAKKGFYANLYESQFAVS